MEEGVVEGGVEMADSEDVLVLRTSAQRSVVGDLFFLGILFLLVFLSLLLRFGLKQVGQRASRSYHICFRSNLLNNNRTLQFLKSLFRVLLGFWGFGAKRSPNGVDTTRIPGGTSSGAILRGWKREVLVA